MRESTRLRALQLLAASAALPACARADVRARYAILLGLDFPDERGIAEELVKHDVALWTIEDVIALLECQLHHPLKWTQLPTLFAGGRSKDAIATFQAERIHGAHTRGLLAVQYAM